jgi:hypothetical protein
MSEQSRHNDSKVHFSGDVSHSVVTINKMELGSIIGEMIVEEKQEIPQSEEFIQEEPRAQKPSQGNIESMQASPPTLKPQRTSDCLTLTGQPPVKILQIDPNSSQQSPDQLEKEKMYRDKIARELRIKSPPRGAIELAQPLKN